LICGFGTFWLFDSRRRCRIAVVRIDKADCVELKCSFVDRMCFAAALESAIMKKVFLLGLFMLTLLPLAGGFFFTRKVGKIKTDTDGVTLHLDGAWWSRITVGPEAKAVEAKKGTYRPRRLYRNLERKIVDEKGNEKGETWRIYSFGPWGKLGKITVKKDETTELKFGGPLIVKPTVSLPRKSGGRLIVTMGLKLVGEYGEEYSVRVAATNKKGIRRSLKEPKLKIFDETGKELANGKFAFG